MEHDIVTAKTSAGLHLTCTCGWQATATEDKFVQPLKDRHDLSNNIWPFKDIQPPEGWPFNE